MPIGDNFDGEDFVEGVDDQREPLTTVVSNCLDEIRTCHTLMDSLMKSVLGRDSKDTAEAMNLESLENVLHETRSQAVQLRVRFDELITAIAG